MELKLYLKYKKKKKQKNKILHMKGVLQINTIIMVLINLCNFAI